MPHQDQLHETRNPSEHPLSGVSGYSGGGSKEQRYVSPLTPVQREVVSNAVLRH